MDFQANTNKTPFPQYIKPYPKSHFYWTLFLSIVMAIAAGLLIAVENYKTQVEIDTMAVSEIGFTAPRHSILEKPDLKK